jgi:ABC-type polysaccharide/polyol phosphate export permease
MPQASQRWLHLLRHFVARDLRQRYLGSLWGGAWALLQPLLTLAIYAVVFVEVLRVRLPEAAGAGFVPFFAAGLWPWTAFAESINRAMGAIPENAGLLGKVALPSSVLVVAPISTGFLIHGLGFVGVMALLSLLGQGVALAGLLAAAPMFALLYLLAVGLGLLLAALQVFVRDLAQVVAQLLALLFFLTPIVYAREMVPPRFAQVLGWNPLTAFIEGVRAPLLGTPSPSWWLPLVASAVALLLGIAVFRRLSRHFEDFL